MAKRNKSEATETNLNDNGGSAVTEQAFPPETNGTSALATEPQPAMPIVEPTVTVPEEEHPAVLRYQKAPSQVFYAVVGESKDGAVDCLSVTKTRGQAEKAMQLLGMAVKRHYTGISLWKCRPVDAE